MLRIATRGSDLALAQTEYIQSRLHELGYETQQRIVKTTGDINLAPFALASGDERKGLFTKEIEDVLLSGEAEIAVHSYKDLPTVSVPELILAAIPQRLDARDYILFQKKHQVSEQFPFLPLDSRIGTSSVRRRSQLNHLFPSLQVHELRGNVPTRVRRLFEDGGPDGILLSGAGVQRLIEQQRFVAEELFQQLAIFPVSIDDLVPAPAQGTLAVQCRSDNENTRRALNLLHDHELARIVSVERQVLAALEGGCHLPLGIHAHVQSGYTEASVYLGKEFRKSRYGKSVQLKRRHTDYQKLIEFLVCELKEPGGGVPLYVFGKQDRMASLQKRYADVTTIGVIEIRSLIAATTELLKNDTSRLLLACFSAEVIRIIHGLPGDKNFFERSGVLWGVPGEKTAALLKTFGVADHRIIIGQDGTGAGLARTLCSPIVKDRMQDYRIIGCSAAEGREEFYEILMQEGQEVQRLDLYETLTIHLEKPYLDSLPDAAYLFFGSPSSFRSFASGLEASGRDWSHAWRICSIGKTTTDAIRKHSADHQSAGPGEPYLTASRPDYDAVITEILGQA